MKNIKIIFQLFLLLAFLAGIYTIINLNKYKKFEGLEDKHNEVQDKTDGDCPNLLVRKGNTLLLYNTNLPIIDNKNPLPFYNLDEYINYLEIQRKKGIDCPVLFLQQENDTQGNDVYRVRKNPFDMEGGLPTTTTLYKENDKGMPVPVIDSGRENAPYNQNNYASFDAHGIQVGQYTTLDAIHDKTKTETISDNPMDTNWGGVPYTLQVVNSGKYDENNITKPLLYQPRGNFDPTIPTGFNQPKDIL